MAVHVSIHDVTPAFAPEVELALAMCRDHGVRPALLVVPNYHARALLTDDAAFVARLRWLQRDGHEIYLHGFFHKSRPSAEPAFTPARDPSSARPSGFAWYFAQRVVSGGEAEFSDVSRDEAIDRLTRGEEVLRAAGLTIDGFVAPAWSMPPWVMPLLRARGYRFTEDHTHVYAPDVSRSRASVVLNYASRSPARLFSTVGYCRLAKYARSFLPARIALHPADMRFSLLRTETEHLLSWAKGDFVCRGADLLTA